MSHIANDYTGNELPLCSTVSFSFLLFVKRMPDELGAIVASSVL